MCEAAGRVSSYLGAAAGRKAECQDPGRMRGVPEGSRTEGSWAVTENKMCFTICSWR